MSEENQSVIQPPTSFVFGSVPAVPGPTPPPPTLGPLAPMLGSWTGTGLNTIFRPQSKQTPTIFTTPVAQTSPNPPNDNVLELNVTSEQTTFTAIPGGIPNRGMVQGDITLAGMTYLQSISDVLMSPPTGIHIEPGIWVVLPPTTDPSEPATVTRMASIPHGTTVNAQGTATVGKGPPMIPSVNITPFPIGGGALIPFPSQSPGLTNTSRIPQTLPSLLAQAFPPNPKQGDEMTDPTAVLRGAIAGLNITSTTQVQISTNVVAPVVAGGGVDNIAFLVNKGPDVLGGTTGPNAQTLQMTATFWIETVEQAFTLPPFKAGSPPIQVPLQPGLPPQLAPSLTVDPGRTLTAPTKVTLTFTMIQYSQTVVLNFNGLSWPHVSVATLVPVGTLTVPASTYG